MPRLSGTALVDFEIVSGNPTPQTNNTIRLRNRSGNTIEDWEFRFGRAFCPGEITVEPKVRISGNVIESQVDVKNSYSDGSIEFAVVSVVVPELPPDEDVLLEIFDGSPNGNNGKDFELDLKVILIGTDGNDQTVDFGKALKDGYFTVWAEGSVADTIVIADDSISRALDFGFDGTSRPLRMKAVVTNWHKSGRQDVRVIGEGDLTTELSDLSYSFQILFEGDLVYEGDLSGEKRHWTMSRWTKHIDTGREKRVDVDFNVNYLVETGWLPSYKERLTVKESALSYQYSLWTGRKRDIYDGQWNGGLWQNAMGTTGGRADIGPFPTWETMAILSGDWRLREMTLGMADLAAAWPCHLRETDETKLFLRDLGDSGLGKTISLTDRRTFLSQNLTYEYTKPEDKVVFVGPRGSQPWSFDGAHQPQCFFIPYLMTGDPFYLDEAYLWAGFSAALYNGSATTQVYGRGPTGAEGVINDQVRGAGWVLRNRVEAALMAPDTDSEKQYFVTLTKDALARWEGGMQIVGTVLDGQPSKTWGAKYGNYYSANNGPNTARPPTLGNWESNGNPVYGSSNSEVIANVNNGIWKPNVVGSWTSAWMQYYAVYGLGRAVELGMPAKPLLEKVSSWITGLVLETGFPKLICAYRSPVEAEGGGFLDWGDFVGVHQESWLTGDGWVPPNSGATTLDQYWDQNLNAQGRETWVLPSASFLTGFQGGEETWKWLEENLVKGVEGSVLTFEDDPTWAIWPRPKKKDGRVLRIGRAERW